MARLWRGAARHGGHFGVLAVNARATRCWSDRFLQASAKMARSPTLPIRGKEESAQAQCGPAVSASRPSTQSSPPSRALSRSARVQKHPHRTYNNAKMPRMRTGATSLLCHTVYGWSSFTPMARISHMKAPTPAINRPNTNRSAPGNCSNPRFVAQSRALTYAVTKDRLSTPTVSRPLVAPPFAIAEGPMAQESSCASRSRSTRSCASASSAKRGLVQV